MGANDRLIKVAEACVSRGWPVLPCRMDKTAMLKSWQNNATKDLLTVSDWTVTKSPFMLAHLTGEVAGHFVVDGDRHKADEDGVAAFLAIWKEHEGTPEPDTYTVETPTGGRHWYFAMPKDGEKLGNRIDVVPSVDVKGTGGYVMAAGSVNAQGGEYRLINGKDPMEPPAWLLSFVREKRKEERATTQGGGVALNMSLGGVDLHPFAEKALNEELEKVRNAKEGTRNQTLNNAALALGHYVGGGGLPESLVREELKRAAEVCGLTRDDGGDKAVLATIESGLKKGKEEPKEIPEKPAPSVVRPLREFLDKDVTARPFAEYPPAFDWLLQNSLRRGFLGVIAGPPGAGKGMISVQLCVAVASGLPWLDAWHTTRRGRAMYLSAEDDWKVMHKRFHWAVEPLPEEMRKDVLDNIIPAPVPGDVSLFYKDKNGQGMCTQNFHDLKALIVKYRPDVVVLDTMARFFGVEENDNPLISYCCAQLEALCRKYDCNIILTHHTNKAAGDGVNKSEELDNALSQAAIRGASALAGCVRWALAVAPLGGTLARERIVGAGDEPGKSFVALNVCKKNAGAPERTFYFGRDKYGLLYRVEENKERKTARDVERDERIEQDARTLLVAIERRAEKGLPPVSRNRGVREILGGGDARSRDAIAYAIRRGWLEEKPNPNRKDSTILVSTFLPDPKLDEARQEAWETEWNEEAAAENEARNE